MCDQSSKNEPKLSIPMVFFLGLAPGLVILFWAFFFSSPFFGINFSIVLSLMLAIILGLIPTELGILKFIARKENKKIKEKYKMQDGLLNEYKEVINILKGKM